MSAKTAVTSVGRTLAFHLASFTFGAFLFMLCCLTGSTVLLPLVCLVSGSQGVRRFVAFLWRAEMQVNELVAQEDGGGGDNDRDYDWWRRHHHEHHHPHEHRRQPPRPRPRPPTEPGQDMTVTVMLISLLYFLLFKWVLNLIFSVIPLALWVVCAMQLLPAGSALASESFVASDSVTVKIFTAVAFAFFAHQLGISAARGLCHVSDRAIVYMFDSASGTAPTTESSGSIFQSSIFNGIPGVMESMPMQPGSSPFVFAGQRGSQYGTAGTELSEQDIDSAIPRDMDRLYAYDNDEYDDVRGLRQFAPPGGSLESLTTLDTSRKYRDYTYDALSPGSTPTNFRSGDNNSFLDSAPDYDPFSPTNSIQDGEFPSEKFQQVYRSIRRTGGEGVAASTTGLTRGFGDDALDRRDRVNFSAFAPPAVSPTSTTPFIYSVWAFLLSQRADMYERAQSELPEAQRLSMDAKLDVRRGALVHVTLDVPDGFRILNGATQGFPWEGKISSVKYQVKCTERVPVGPVLFKARIVVGAEVAVLRSYVIVSSSGMAAVESESLELLESSLEVLEKTYREIPYRSLELKELVGQGYFGDAYRATLDGQEVVVKTIRSSEFGETSTQIVKEFQHEAAVLNMFGHHPCIVPFVGASTDVQFPLCLVTEYLPFGSLEDHLRKPQRADAALSTAQKTSMLKDAAAGLLNIHEGGFIHRDIAARNCLVDDNLRVRVCDFGLCRRVNASGSGLMRDAFGPVKYMAPESLQPPHVFSYASDAYMFGVLMWETYTSSAPFPRATPVEAMMRITRGERLTVPSALPEELRLLMETCFRDSPQERPTMSDILATLDDSVSARAGKSPIAAAAMAATASSVRVGRRDRSIWA